MSEGVTQRELARTAAGNVEWAAAVAVPQKMNRITTRRRRDSPSGIQPKEVKAGSQTAMCTRAVTAA